MLRVAPARVDPVSKAKPPDGERIHNGKDPVADCFLTEALQAQVGQRDGQQLFIRENDGSVTAHLWSSSTSQWNLVSFKVVLGILRHDHVTDPLVSDRHSRVWRRHRC